MILIPALTSGQVVIEERVEISESESRVDVGAKTLTAADTLVVEADGLLTVRYDSAKSALIQIWQDADLTVTKNDSVFQIDTVRSRFGDPIVNSYFCSAQDDGVYYEYYSQSGPPASAAAKTQFGDSEWIVGPVSEGDRIAFDYQGDRTGEYVTGPNPTTQDTSWTGGLLRCSLQVQGKTVTFYTDAIFFVVKVLPDTLDIHFNPSEDGTDYPEPGLVVEVKASALNAENNGEVLFEIENHDYPWPPGPDTLIYLLSEDGMDTTLTLPPVEVEDDTALVRLVAKQYWGVVDVTAKYILNGDTVHIKTERWPEDDDRDGIADRWEVDNGFASMPNQFASCVSPTIECTELDVVWDSEASTFATDTLGDGISKLREYQGAIAGGTHFRLSPEEREVFIDPDDNPFGSWAVTEVVTQLGLDVHIVDGLLRGIGDTLVPGSSALRWPGGLPSSEWYHYVLLDSVAYGDPSLDPYPPKAAMTPHEENHYYRGQAIIGGIYQWHLLSVTHPACHTDQVCQYTADPLSVGNQAFGWTIPHPIWGRFWLSQTFLGSINNIWSSSGNSLAENTGTTYSRGHWFLTGGADSSGVAQYDAKFPISTSASTINPFDLVSNVRPTLVRTNNAPAGDGIALTLSQDDFARRSTLHELGHALGMYKYTHPLVGRSVMRQGIGPAKTTTFTTDDKRQLTLR